jgi:hypothetical protein
MAGSREAFPEVFDRLKRMLALYAARMHVSADSDGWYGLDLAPPEERTPATWFGAVRLGKSYVSYYLMPVYAQPSLLDDASPELRKRMQGKSCFNFTRVDQALFAELTSLTRRGYEVTAGDAEWGKRQRASRDKARSSR